MMRLLIAFRALIVVCVAFLLAIPAQGAIVTWTDWTSATTSPDTVTGSMGGIGVKYTGDYKFVQLGGPGTNYWTEPNPLALPYTGSATVDNAPTPLELIALDAAATHKIVFAQPVTNPIMAIVSLGRVGTAWTVALDFDKPFTVLSEGEGAWGDGTYSITGNVLYGNELHCAIQFEGTVSAITWTSAPSEYWHGFTVGYVVPEPATLIIWSLLGLSSGGLWMVRRRRNVGAGRTPWSEENRAAIRQLIGRGRS